MFEQAELCTLYNSYEFNYASQFTTMDGWVSKAYTFWADGLSETPYSVALKLIIFECMYAENRLRPDLRSLKTRIKQGLKAAQMASPFTKPWTYFVHPEPEEREWDVDTLIRVLSRRRWGRILRLLLLRRRVLR